MTDWMVLDVSNLMWRSFYARDLFCHYDPVLSAAHVCLSIPKIAQTLEASNVAFAFDRPPYLRRQVLQFYKSGRTNPNDVEADVKDELRAMIQRLRTSILPQLGYESIYSKAGYEADDIMAALVQGIPKTDRVILVTGDRDLYQLLDKRIAVYHPIGQRFITARWFRDTYGIKPNLWAEVRCLAGCTTDQVPGLEGITEDSAVQFFRGDLNGTDKARRMLDYNRSPDYIRNRKLIVLPYKGLDSITPVEQSPYPATGWKPLADALDIDVATLFQDTTPTRSMTARGSEEIV